MTRSLNPAVLVLILAAAGLRGPSCSAAFAADPVLDTRGKLEIRSADGDFVWRIDGRVHIDANWFQDDGGVDFGSGSHLRRGRLGMEGLLWRHWRFKFQYDFTGSGRAGVQDAYLRYTALGRSELTVGHFREPLSLEYLTGANSVPLIERSLAAVFAPGRNIGLAVRTQLQERVTGWLGLFGEGIAKLSDTDPATAGLDEGWAVTGRTVWAPVREPDRLWHLGVAASYRRANDHGGSLLGTPLRVRQRPEASVTSIRLVDTGEMPDTDAILIAGVEAAWIGGPFSLQAEYQAMTVARGTPGAIDPTLRGYYVLGSWLLTGESRRYGTTNASFSNPRVRRPAGLDGRGAWELLARYSHLDLTDQPDRLGGVLGGAQTNATVGLTWYANDNIRFMVNYTQVLKLDRPGHPYDGVEPGIMLLRTQVMW
jgi:phosphate-selective porin OprO and OprP